MDKKIKISQCMIVKDEEKNIRRALSWGRDIMWEQIVVDTGSKDRTVEIAAGMGAKVYHFSWVDDFAAAKNYAIQQAKGDWIAFLDADEYLQPEDTNKLVRCLETLQKSRYQGLLTSWIQVDGSEDILQDKSEGEKEKLKWHKSIKADGTVGIALSGTQVRIFRNRNSICYQGRIHEKLYEKNGSFFCKDVSREIAVYHTGYTPSEMEEKKKAERNLYLIKKELEDHPGDYNLMSYLGDSYFQQKKLEEAAKWYQQAVSFMPKTISEDSIQGALIFKHLLLIYMDASDEKAAIKVYEEGIRRFPKEGDFDYIMGKKYVERKQFEKGAHHLQRAIGQMEQYGSGAISALLSHDLIGAWELFDFCLYELGNLQQCVSCSVTILKADPWRKETLKTLLMAFKKDEANTSPSQVLAFLKNLYRLQIPENHKFVLEAAREAEYQNLAAELEAGTF